MDFSPIILPKDSHKTTPAIAIFGGGGKTSLLYRFGKDLSAKYQKILLTSIVKAGPSPYYQIHFVHPNKSILNLFDKDNPLYIMKEKVRDELADGLNKENMIAEEDKILMYKIYLKLKEEFKNLDKSKI